MLDIHISLQEASPNDWLVLIMQDWRSVNGRLLLEYLLFIQNIHILSQNIELQGFERENMGGQRTAYCQEKSHEKQLELASVYCT